MGYPLYTTMPNKVQYGRPTCVECAVQWDYDVLVEDGELIQSSEEDVVVNIDCPNCGEENNVFFQYVETHRDSKE